MGNIMEPQKHARKYPLISNWTGSDCCNSNTFYHIHFFNKNTSLSPNMSRENIEVIDGVVKIWQWQQ